MATRDQAIPVRLWSAWIWTRARQKLYGQRACLYAQPYTTRNTAEYWVSFTVFVELTARITLLYIVGDSSLILQQMRRHRPPRHPRLRQLYIRARRCAKCPRYFLGGLIIIVHNKMADLAANVAMDSQKPQLMCANDNRSLIAGLKQFLHNDVHQWQVCSEAHNPGLHIATPIACVTSGPRVVV